MDRIQLRAVQSQGQLRSISTELSLDRHRGWPTVLCKEVQVAVQSQKKGKSDGVDNIPAEVVQTGWEECITPLTAICDKIWQTGEWPIPWTQSLVITLPKKGHMQQCQNYRTISIISHPSKVMLKIILNRLTPQAEEIIVEEQAGFRAGTSTTKQVFSQRVHCEKYLQYRQDLFIDFKKAFDRACVQLSGQPWKSKTSVPTSSKSSKDLWWGHQCSLLQRQNNLKQSWLPAFWREKKTQNTQEIKGTLFNWTKQDKTCSVPFSVCQPPTSNRHKMSWINCLFYVFMLYVA